MKTCHNSSRLLMLFVALICCVTLSSCDEDEYYGNPLVGRWQLIAPSNVDYNEYSFYANGTGTYYIVDAWGEGWYSFTWDNYGDQLAVYFDNGDTWYFAWTVQGYNLYLYPDNSGIPLVYQYY